MTATPKVTPAMFLLDNPMAVFRALAYLAFSDGHITGEERAAMMALADQLHFTGEERERCLAMLQQRPGLDGLGEELDPEEAKLALSQAMVMSLADETFSRIEEQDVARLAAELGLSDEDVARIRAAVEEQYRG